MSPALEGLGERIRTARGGAGLSQAQLGAPHFTRAYVSAVELGKIRPSMKSMEYLAQRLGKPVSFFVLDEAAQRRRQERDFAMLRAKDLIARGQTNEAIGLLEPQLADDIGPLDEAHVRRLLGIASHVAREPRAAVAQLTRSIEILERLGSEREVQRARRDLAAALLEAGLADQALAIYRRLLEAIESEPSRDPIFRMAVFRGLGATYSMLGDAAAAVAYYQQALDYAQDVADLSSLGRIYSGLAYSYWLARDHEAAVANLHRAISIHQDAQDIGAVAELHNNLAMICVEQKHFERAREHVRDAQRIAQGLGRPVLNVHLKNTEAEIALQDGELANCRELCAQALAMASAAQFARGRASALRLLGRLNVREGKRFDAESSFSEAAMLFASIQMRSIAAECLYELSRAFADWGDVGKAGEFATRAYEMSRAKN